MLNKFNMLSCVLLIVLAILLPGSAAADRASRTTPTVRVVQKASKAVVNINTKSQAQRIFNTQDEVWDQFFRDFFDHRPRERSSLGTGFIIDGKKRAYRHQQPRGLKGHRDQCGFVR